MIRAVDNWDTGRNGSPLWEAGGLCGTDMIIRSGILLMSYRHSARAWLVSLFAG